MRDQSWSSSQKTVACGLLILDQFMKDCILWEKHHAGVGEQSEDEEVAETKPYGPTITFIPHFLALLRGKEVEES